MPSGSMHTYGVVRCSYFIFGGSSSSPKMRQIALICLIYFTEPRTRTPPHQIRVEPHFNHERKSN